MKEFHHAHNIHVGQVVLKISDLQHSLKFYQEVIGLRVLHEEADRATLTADGLSPLLILEQPEHVTKKHGRTTGLYHFALLVPSRRDLADLFRHLLEVKWPLQGAADHFVSEAIYLADPDGNGIELYSDRPASTWKWENGEVLMATEPLDYQHLLSEEAKEWSGISEQTIIGHIHLHVAEWQETEKFYGEGLGFEVVCRYGTQALFVSTARYHHHIGLNTWNGLGAPAPAPESTGLRYFTLILPSAEERTAVVQRLQSLGFQVTELDDRVAVEDPSGTAIHLLTYGEKVV
ncbi:VOC family protein [Alkalihalobacillus oceani]|uniref:VOC family protein n=1 Tax=Halalkalibacter oceani TaxID=1653776 RepID=A0A9X2DWB9_9BACI|nr:VOC family protein [Halalkalibacter oceani]MCM3716413.1 VOC family protein [Halalkalibacter oceani]